MHVGVLEALESLTGARLWFGFRLAGESQYYCLLLANISQYPYLYPVPRIKGQSTTKYADHLFISKQCFDSRQKQSIGDLQKIAWDRHVTTQKKCSGSIRTLFIVFAISSSPLQVWLKMVKANGTIERPFFFMDQRLATVKMWPRTWAALQSGFIS